MSKKKEPLSMAFTGGSMSKEKALMFLRLYTEFLEKANVKKVGIALTIVEFKKPVGLRLRR